MSDLLQRLELKASHEKFKTEFESLVTKCLSEVRAAYDENVSFSAYALVISSPSMYL